MKLLILKNSFEFFQFFFVFESFFLILNNERNVTNFEYVFVPRFHITHKIFPGDAFLEL